MVCYGTAQSSLTKNKYAELIKLV